MKNIICISFLLFLAYTAKAQNIGINNANTPPHPSAMLDINSSNKGETLGMNYGHLSALLVKGIQEQQNQIQELKSELESQKDKMEKLEALVSNFIQNNFGND